MTMKGFKSNTTIRCLIRDDSTYTEKYFYGGPKVCDGSGVRLPDISQCCLRLLVSTTWFLVKK